MKKKLLSFVLATITFTTISTAQTKIWDFNDPVAWPDSPGIGINPLVVDNLGLYPIPSNTNFGAVNNGGATFTDGFMPTRRFQMGGAGYPSGPFQVMPTQRFLFIGVSGTCTIKVWFRPSSNGTVRTTYVTNGTTTIGSATSNADGNSDATILTTTYTGGATALYIYGDAACNLFKIEVTGATVATTLGTLRVDDFEQVTTKVHSYKDQVFVSNVLTASEVKVYNIMGALVKSFTTTTDTDFQLNQSGLYIVNLRTEEGEKSVKVMLN